MDEQPLLEKRIGGKFGYKGGEKYSKASWPLGKLTMYSESLNLRLFLISIDLLYSEIKLIEKSIFTGIRIRHTNSAEPEYVTFTGFGLYNELKRLNQQHNLGLKII